MKIGIEIRKTNRHYSPPNDNLAGSFPIWFAPKLETNQNPSKLGRNRLAAEHLPHLLSTPPRIILSVRIGVWRYLKTAFDHICAIFTKLFGQFFAAQLPHLAKAQLTGAAVHFFRAWEQACDSPQNTIMLELFSQNLALSRVNSPCIVSIFDEFSRR
jgi:hypothetical protein